MTVPGSTSDLKEQLLAQLSELVPGAFVDGNLDSERLLQSLGIVDQEESWRFTWPGSGLARQEAMQPTTATLVPDPEASMGWEDARDILIEGDNLQVLKLLQNGYAGSVKLIYIDPPYNTGDTFTYTDDYSVREAEYLRASGQVDESGEITTSRLEVRGRKHAPWLTMMFPRLVAARGLLRRDGVIFVSIDNNEVHHLRLLLDGIFGAENFVDMMTWQGGRKGDAKLTAGGQDYILIYARDMAHLKELDTRWRERKTGLEDVYTKEKELLTEFGSDFEAAGKALRDWYRSLPEGNPAKQHDHFNQIDEMGVWTSGDASSPNFRSNLVYEFEGYPPPDNGWRYEPEVMESLSRDGKLLYPSDDGGRIRIKRYLRDQEEWAPASVFYKERGAAQTSLDTLMGKEVFAHPKDPGVLARLIEGVTGEKDIVLDFFAGSGSTGRAVWEQSCNDGIARRWVLVQAPEKPDPSTASGKNAADLGYETIFEITAERLRRTAAHLQPETSDARRLGFRVFRTRETHLIIEPSIVATEETTGESYLRESLDLADRAPVIDGADPLAVAWEVVLKASDTRLDASVTEHTFDDITVFEFSPIDQANSPAGRLFVSLDSFDLKTAEKLQLSDSDTLFLRSDRISDETAATLAPRLLTRLILLERTPREVSN